MKKKLLIISIILTISALLIKYIIYNSNEKKTLTLSSNSEINLFKKEGELVFISTNNDTVTKINIELAKTNYEKQTGLMYRKSMNFNEGMFFIFDNSDFRSFWMKNTYISLDIIYISSEMKILSIHPNTTPFSLKNIPSEKPAQYVLEVNAGFCQQFKINNNYKIKFIEIL